MNSSTSSIPSSDGSSRAHLSFRKSKATFEEPLLRRFPYAVYFGVTRETVELIALLHQHRDPRTWEKRIIAE